jgi:hypothetical protein
MRRYDWLCLGLFLAVSTAAGCSSHAVLLGPRPDSGATVGERVQGNACGLLVGGVIPAGVNSRTERAYRNALAGRGRDLTDTQIQYSWLVIPALGYWVCTTVEGRVVQ